MSYRKISWTILFVLFSLCVEAQYRKPLWIWNSYSIIGNTTEENILLNECLSTGVTDIYLYTAGSLLENSGSISNVRSFISKATCLDIRVWGMDGWRGYFSDLCGPEEFYEHIQLVINYNSSSSSQEKFTGFHGDNEFHAYEDESGCGQPDGFHWGKSDAALSTTSGSGIWQDTERKDRDSLLTDFVRQTDIAASMCHDAGIEYGIAVMPWISGISWTNAGMGNQNTPLYATYKGVTKELYKYLMDYVDEYAIMSYHTNVQGKVVYMCEDVLAYADGLSSAMRPRIFSALETFCSVGQYVSYCDTPGEDTKAHINNNEIPAHISNMSSHVSYSGVAIHDWQGWKALSPVSSNSSTPPGASCVSTGVKDNSALKFEIYPNPADKVLLVRFDNIVGEVSVEIVNELGMVVYRQKTEAVPDLSIQLSQLEKGLYILLVSTVEKMQQAKFIKE